MTFKCKFNILIYFYLICCRQLFKIISNDLKDVLQFVLVFHQTTRDFLNQPYTTFDIIIYYLSGLLFNFYANG